MITKVEMALAKALHHESILPPEVLNLHGMSSAKVRHFLSNLVQPWDAYLEIGSWTGSTFISATYGKEFERQPVAVDNFSEFGGPRDQFIANASRLLPHGWRLIEMDCFTLDCKANQLENIDIFFYDGGHDEASQRRALTHFKFAFKSEFILIVDDWNMPTVQRGTAEGIMEAKIEVIRDWVLPAAYNGDHEQWWDGLYVAVCQI